MMAGAVEKIVNYRMQMHGAGRMSASLRGVATAGAAVGAALVAAGAAVYTMVNRVTEAAAEIEDMSRATGIAASELAALGYVLEQDGADIGALETGVRKMTRTINDANTGMKEYQDTFTQIGVDYAALQGLLPEEQFYILADAIANVEDQSVKMALAQELFGRGAMALLPTLDRGADGIRVFTDEARELGIVLGDEVYEASKKFQDKMLEIKSTIQGELLQAITDPENGILPAFENFGETLAEVAREDLGDAIASLAAALPALLQIAENILTMLGNINAARSFIMDQEEADVIAEQAHARILSASFSMLAASGNTATDGYYQYKAAAEEINFLNKELILTQLEYGTAWEEWNNTVNRSIDLSHELIPGYQDWFARISTFSVEQLNQELNDLDDALNEGIISQEAYMAALDAVYDMLENPPPAIETISISDASSEEDTIEIITENYNRFYDRIYEKRLEIEDAVIAKKLEGIAIEEEWQDSLYNKRLDITQSFIDKKLEGVAIEMQMQEQVNNLMMSGAQNMGRILLRGGEDWEKQMMAALVKMALQYAAMQAGPIGFIGGFLGGFL